jgi:hypothetical protein
MFQFSPEFAPYCATVPIYSLTNDANSYSYYSCVTNSSQVPLPMYMSTLDGASAPSDVYQTTINPNPQNVTTTVGSVSVTETLIWSSGSAGWTEIVYNPSATRTATLSLLSTSPAVSTNTTSPLPSSLTSVAPTLTPTPTSTPNPHHSNAGAIAGGVVGGVAALALIAGAVYFLTRRKQRQREAPLPEISQYSGTPKIDH